MKLIAKISLLAILVISTAVNAYVLLTNSWASNNIVFYTGLNTNEDGTSAADYQSALNNAMTSWHNNSNFQYSINSAYKDPCDTSNSDINSARFKGDICGTAFGITTLAIASSSHYSGTTNKARAYIIFNSSKSWGIHDNSSNSPTDFKRVALHEVGHTLGIGHEEDNASIMYPSYQSNITTLQPDDINGIRAIYGTYDHGDNTSTATAISFNTNVSGNIDTGDDDDYFSISVPAGGDDLDIYSTSSIDTYGYLLDSSGSVIAEHDDLTATDKNFKITRTLSAGTYYIRVKGHYFATTGTYTLRADITNAISTPDGINATDGSSSSYVRVSWNSVNNASSYIVYRSNGSEGVYSQIASTSSSSYDDSSVVVAITYSYKIKACTGSNGTGICSDYSDYASGYISSVPIADAIDNASLSFVANWFGQAQTFYYDSDAAQSGNIGDDQQSCMQTTVAGSSDLSFYWKVSSRNSDYLRFYIDNSEQSGKISGDIDWQQKFYQLSPGNKALKWCYTKDFYGNGHSDAGWVDKIVHATNDSSISAPTGVSASNGSYTSYVQVSWDSVSSTATYAIYRSTSENGTYLQIAESPSSHYNDTLAGAGTTYYYKIKACTGSVGSIACSNYSDYASGYLPSVLIADAVDNTNLSFTSSGDANWFGQTQTFYYDSDAAQSGIIGYDQQSCMQTTVAGSSDLSFYWKVSSESGYDYLRFYIDDSEQSGKISGDTDWQQKSYVLSAGEKVLKWCYTKDRYVEGGSDTGWVDKIVHAINDSSIQVPTNINASNGSYTSYIQVSWDSVSSTATYAIYRSTSENGTYLQIADSQSLSYNDTLPIIGNTYYYKIKACTGSVGSVACGGYSNYASGYISSVPIADAIDNANLSFTSSGDANWFGQTPTFYYDSDAAQSGIIGYDQQSCMQTTVAGSSDLSFHWKVSSESDYDYLEFYIDDSEQSGKISGDTDWQQKSYVLSAGDKVLKWCYTKDRYVEGGSDTGWVDKIVHATNDSSISAPSNVSASNGSYTSYVQVSWDSVSSTATYAIYRSTSADGTYLQIADSSSSPYNDTLAAAAETTHYYKIKACTGSVGSVACGNYSDYASGYLLSVPIADAVDNTNLSFTSSGDANWFGQTQTFYYDSDAAQSGNIGDNQQSCMQTTVAGSSDLSFHWKVSSESGYDYLRFYIDDSEQSGKISGNTDWQQKFYQLSAGEKVLRWCYIKNESRDDDSDTGWVDKIVHAVNDSSIPTPTGVSASNGSYTSYVQVSWDSVSSTATYVIYRSTSENGTYSQIADSQSLSYNDTLPIIGNTYYYKIKACTASVGSVACGNYSDYASGYLLSVPIADAIDNTNLSFTSSGDANWYGQTPTFYYDSDAAQSGDIGDNQQSCMQTTVAGSSDLSFYWKVSSGNYDYLRFYIDDSVQSGRISGETDWQQKFYQLSAGDKALKWCYSKDLFADGGSDAGWVDKIVNTANSAYTAPNIAFLLANITTVVGIYIDISATNTGGVVTYSISPAIDNGLSFNTTDGTISGTPTAVTVVTYTVTASNISGNSTATIKITVNPVAPNISLSTTTITAVVGIAIDNITVANTGGTATSYAISPALNVGLSFSTETGAISGTPSAVSSAMQYTVTASNVTGTDSATIEIAVNPQAPNIAFSPATITAIVGIYVDIRATNTGGVATYSISPAIANNLSFNTETGSISGTPTAVTLATYTVTASNVTGTDSATIEITVNPPAPIIELLPATITATVGEAIGNITVNNTGGTATSYAISPAIGNGLSFSTATGIISGTPTTTTAGNSIEWTIIAINETGNGTATFDIIINPAAPNISLSVATFTAVVKTAISGIIITNSAGQELTTCTSNPTLPAGISIVVSADKSTCEFSGTPSTTQDAQTYIITATNITASSTDTISITVNPELPIISLSAATVNAELDMAITDITVINSGGTPTSYAISDTLSAGLSFSTTTGTISGTPNSTATAIIYTVTATNITGTDSATLSLSITVNVAITFSLDIDGNGSLAAPNDGLIIFKYLLNSNANNLHTTIANDAATDRRTTADLKAYLDNARTILDVDGNDSLAAPNDGLIIFKYLLNSNANNLHTTTANDAATDRKTTKDLKAYLDTYRK